jgi:hypothetical protein
MYPPSITNSYVEDREISYIDPHLEVRTSEERNYNKRDDFNFFIVNFAFICSNIPAAPVYI